VLVLLVELLLDNNGAPGSDRRVGGRVDMFRELPRKELLVEAKVFGGMAVYGFDTFRVQLRVRV